MATTHDTTQGLNISGQPDQLSPGIPGYTIESVIGYGGCSTVYLARQHNLQRQVALKVMNPLLTGDPDLCSRFVREAQDTASLSNHPNIVTVHDVGQAEGLYYIAMQFISGPSLKHLIDTASIHTSAESLIYPLAQVLKYIHERGFIHRDIKPANILFDEADQIVLSDFGVATLNTHTTQLTRHGTVLGTAKYMSPEQCRGDTNMDARSDLYSLGVVLYEVLTGQAPFEASEPMALMFKQLNEPVPTLPIELSRYQPLIDGLMAKNADQRFASADHLMHSIDQLGSDSPEHRNNSPVQIRRSSCTHGIQETQASTVTGVALLLLVILLGVLMYFTLWPDTMMSNSEPACATLNASDRQQRDALIKLATVHEQIGRLTYPPGANAMEAYSLALEIDPCNRDIQTALKNIRHE